MLCHPVCVPPQKPVLLRAGGCRGLVRLRAGRNAGGRQCLLSGIFPLVPGAGIYYTAYYFIQGNNALALSNGISTFKVAVALAIGITLVLSVPIPKKRRN